MSDLDEVPSPSKTLRVGVVHDAGVDAVVTSELRVVRVEHYPEVTTQLRAQLVVREALRRVEVEGEYESSPLEHHHLVLLVLPVHEPLHRSVSEILRFASE